MNYKSYVFIIKNLTQFMKRKKNVRWYFLDNFDLIYLYFKIFLYLIINFILKLHISFQTQKKNSTKVIILQLLKIEVKI